MKEEGEDKRTDGQSEAIAKNENINGKTGIMWLQLNKITIFPAPRIPPDTKRLPSPPSTDPPMYVWEKRSSVHHMT